ncbi:MAG: carboxypeptidase-like regulatory domain-containing protein [Oscillospiraceae bacterium]|nr:carboxypeptidase-like regulatory domain-containing protein [Oscillospiraceae bacterium]
MNVNFYIRPGVNERVEAQVELVPDARSAVYGVVRTEDGLPVSGALVLLFETGRGPEEAAPSSQMFTDENGRFAFGPLAAGTLYMLSVYKNAVKLRELELITGDA